MYELFSGKMLDILNPFQPADFHLLIPTFAWAGIATTNYDLVVERAYQRAPSPLQKVVPNVKDGDGATDQGASVRACGRDGPHLRRRWSGCPARRRLQMKCNSLGLNGDLRLSLPLWHAAATQTSGSSTVFRSGVQEISSRVGSSQQATCAPGHDAFCTQIAQKCSLCL
jgi:hypothetical protein